MGSKPPSRVVADNRRAFHEYHILETVTAGIELAGTEVKSLRAGQASLMEAYARIENGEIWIHRMHIAPYSHGNRYNLDPMRPRRLLVHRREILRFWGKTREQGLTLIPLKVFWSGNWAKVEIGLAKGKKLHDKREAIAARDVRRDVERTLRERSR
ncbi:MAG: SsrA-binding protein SmpB [bacterium]|jgi:SsrA-binding protein|nr:SsrA-binding protein SmpB [bacterium]